MTEVDEFFASLQEDTRLKRVYWSFYRKFVMVAASPKAVRRTLTRWTQRARRGWADEDTWSLDRHLSRVIAESVEHLRNHGHGYGNGVDEEEWDEILEAISEGFRIYADKFDEFAPWTGEEKVKRDIAWDLLRKHYEDLLD